MMRYLASKTGHFWRTLRAAEEVAAPRASTFATPQRHVKRASSLAPFRRWCGRNYAPGRGSLS